MGRGKRARGKNEPAADRLIVWLAAFVCLFFVNTLSDVGRRYGPPQLVPAPPVPDSIVERDASLRAIVVDESDRPIAGASVRVFAIRDKKAYFAGDHDTDGAGAASFERLPRGETWVLAYGAALARASSRAVLEAGPREVKLVLRAAKALDVVVVGDDDQPITGAEVEVRTADPLPYVATTDATGGARLDRLGAPPYTVRASYRGYDDVTRSNVVPATTPLRIRLEHLASIEVTVVGEDDKPVAGATVLAAGTGLWPARSSTTDANGVTRIMGLHGGVYDLKARLDDLVSKTDLAVPVKRGETKSVKLTLRPGRRVLVSVTDGDGEGAPPVKGANVALVEEGLSSFPLYGKTNDKGLVELGPIAKTSASVSARATGFVPKSAVLVPVTAKDVHIALDRGGVIEGDVVDDRGYPVAGATIEIIGVDVEGMPVDENTAMNDFTGTEFALALPGPTPLIPMGELGVMPGPIPDLPQGNVGDSPAPPERGGDPWVTRADGTFRCDPVTPGRLHVIVRHPSYVETMSDLVTLKPGGEAKVHIVMREGGWIEGRVLEEDGKRPVSGARVELAAINGALERVTYAADDGTFTFPAAPEEVMLSVSRPESPGDIAARVVIDVPDRDRKRIEILLPKVRDTIKVRVTDDRGYAIDRVEVHAVSLDVAIPLRKTVFTDADGGAEIPDAVGVPIRFSLTRPSKAPHTEVIDPAPAEVKFVLSEGVSGHGEVTSHRGHDRIEGAEVTMFTATGARHGLTDAEGAYRFEDLSPGRVRISVRKEGLASAQSIVTIAGDRDHPADLGSIDLPESGEVEGEVLDPHGDGVAGARVAIGGAPAYLPMGPLPPGIVSTDRNGRFTLGGVPEGNVVLEAYSAELGRATSENLSIRAGNITRRVKIALPGGTSPAKEPKGAGSVAVTLGEEKKVVTIVMVPPGSEAEFANIEPGDELLAVNGREVHSIDAARKRLTGPLTEDVVLSLARDEGDGRTTWLTRVRRERVRR